MLDCSLMSFMPSLVVLQLLFTHVAALLIVTATSMSAAAQVAQPSAPAGAIAADSTAASASAASDAAAISIRVEFSGGLELLFDRIKARTLQLSPRALGVEPAALTMRFLIDLLKNQYCTERHELFVAEDSVSGSAWTQACAAGRQTLRSWQAAD
jgi:hypothetical protein